MRRVQRIGVMVGVEEGRNMLLSNRTFKIMLVDVRKCHLKMLVELQIMLTQKETYTR